MSVVNYMYCTVLYCDVLCRTVLALLSLGIATADDGGEVIGHTVQSERFRFCLRVGKSRSTVIYHHNHQPAERARCLAVGM